MAKKLFALGAILVAFATAPVVAAPVEGKVCRSTAAKLGMASGLTFSRIDNSSNTVIYTNPFAKSFVLDCSTEPFPSIKMASTTPFPGPLWLVLAIETSAALTGDTEETLFPVFQECSTTAAAEIGKPVSRETTKTVLICESFSDRVTLEILIKP